MGNLSTPNSVQKLQTALHAKAKAEPGYRFYALYDKISREDILAHAYAQCRSNKGAPGVDRQDFEDIEAYGVERWLGELVPGIAVETRPRDSSASIEIAPGPRTMIQPSRTAQYRCSGDGPFEPCSAQASNRSGSATMREQRPIMSSVGHRTAITAPSGDATTRSTVGAIALARDIVI